MLLHGQPGSGKSFFVERVRDCTNIPIKITATAGIAATSLGGSTIDWMIGMGFNLTSKTNIQAVRQRLLGIQLLIIDEVSMIGCWKLLKVDVVLKKVFNNTKPFGGMDVLLVGDFAQLAAVREIPIIDTLVNSTRDHVEPSQLTMKIEALFGLFKKFELRTFHRSGGCKKLTKLLRKFRDYASNYPTLTEKDIQGIGLLNKSVLKRDPAFKDATILVTTRKERDCLNLKAGRDWARKHQLLMYWWFQRAGRIEDDLEADQYADSMSNFCPGVKAFFIKGVPCMLKKNKLPPEGYANGSQGRMIQLVFKDSYVLPKGKPGQLIMIPPPEYVIMEVEHHGKFKKKSILPCPRELSNIEYYRDAKKCIYRCYSNHVVLKFALTIHGCQGQTLKRIILLLGRLPGMHVGKITLSLLYVALSRTKQLKHIKLYPCGSSKYLHIMHFQHLVKLSMPETLKKWNRSYVNNSWDRNILRKEHSAKVRKVEKELKKLGEKKLQGLKWEELRSFCKRMSYKTTTKDNKKVLFVKIKTHMVKQHIWSGQIGVESKSIKRKRKKRKREDKEVEVDLVTGKLITKFSKQSKKKRKLQKMHKAKIDLKSKKVATAKKIKRKWVKKSKVTVEVKCKPKKKKQKKGVLIFSSSEDDDFPTTEKGLANAGNTCYINSIVQCLLHCKLFRDGIAIIPEFVLSNDVVRTLKKLFEKLTEYNVRRYIRPNAFLNAVKDIQACINFRARR